MNTSAKYYRIASLIKHHAGIDFTKSYFELSSYELDTIIQWMQITNYRGQHYGKSKSRSFYDTLVKYFKN